MRFSLFDYLLRRAILLFVIFILVMVVFVAKFEHLTNVNAADCAQLARNLANGKGFTTSVLTPLALSVVPEVDNAPDLGRPPLYIVFLAAAMKIGGASDKTAIFTSIFFYLATLLLVYLIGRSLLNDQVGLFAVVICLVSVPLLIQMVSGLETTLLAFLVTGAFGLLLWWERASNKDAWHWPVAVGVVLGLIYLTRYEALGVALAVLVYLVAVRREHRWRRVALMSVAFALVVLPWVVRCSVLAKRPFISLTSYELIMGTDFSEGQLLYRQFENVPSSPHVEALRQSMDMLKKLNEGIRALHGVFATLVEPFVMPFFLAGLLLATVRKQHAALHWCVALAVSLVTLTVALYVPVQKVIFAFAPVVAVLATFWVASLIEEYLHRDPERSDPEIVLDRKRFGFLLAWIVIISYPFANYLFVDPPAREHPGVRAIKALGADESYQFIATDIPWWVAWYGDKTALLLPTTSAELEQMRKAGIRPDTIYLSPSLVPLPERERMVEWQKALVEGQESILDYKRDTRARRYPGEVYVLPERSLGT